MALTSGKYSHRSLLPCVGNYALCEALGGHIYRAENLHTGKRFICKMLHITQHWESLAVYSHLPSHRNLNEVADVLRLDTITCVFFEQSYGDMHTYVRSLTKLHEDEAARLFHQMASVVAHCHENGVVLLEPNLRKFVFREKERTILKLENLSDAYIMHEDDDSLSGRHGCPAYISPEGLQAGRIYSGKAANAWSLGVMLYSILVGHYPFYDVDPNALFCKIQHCNYSLPDTLSPKAKCLIRSILRRDLSERLTSQEILDHPWFSPYSYNRNIQGRPACKDTSDQMVPCV